MAGEALKLTTDSGQAWRRETTRDAILDAARTLFNQGGLENLSLGAVAAEAGFAPPTVYAYFTNKNDLLIAAVTNDLAALAQAMRDVFPFSEPAEPETTAAAELPPEDEPAGESETTIDPAPLQIVSEKVPEPQLFDSLPEENRTPNKTSSFASNLPTVGKKRRLLERRDISPEPFPEISEPSALMPHPDRVGETSEFAEAEAPQNAVNLSGLKDSASKVEPRKVDAWLERRLRIFEKSLADIETRLANSEQNSTRAAALADEISKTINERFETAEKRIKDGLDGLAQRLENSDKRPRGIAPDLRATINDLYARLETLETGRSAVPATPDLEAQWSEAPQEPMRPAEPEKPITAAAETYLSAARRAASAAAQLAEIEAPRRRLALVDGKPLSRTSLIVMLCGALVLMLVVYGAILRDYFNSKAPHAVPLPPGHHALAKPPTPFEKAAALANRGNITAQLSLGLDYLNGTGIAKNPAEAARLLQLAAEGGEPIGQYWFGTLYERGIGVPADSAQAFHWYQTAAQQGNRRAMYNVAIAYAVGRGTAQDLAQAAQWFKRAAELGYVDAQYNLGVLYERGQGVPQSLTEAYKWYAIAATAGDTDSQARVSALATQLSPDDVTAAQKAAADFKPAPLNKSANLMPAIPARG
jgi:TPR repeat protein